MVLMVYSLVSVNAGTLIVETYNIRNANNGDVINGNGWSQRCPVICGLVEFNDADIGTDCLVQIRMKPIAGDCQ